MLWGWACAGSSEQQALGGFTWRLPTDPAHGRQNLRRFEGLLQNLTRAQAFRERQHINLSTPGSGAHGDDANVRRDLTQFQDRFDAVFEWHEHVADHYIGRVVSVTTYRFSTVFRFDDFVAAVLEHATYGCAK